MSWTRFFRRRHWDEESARELDAYIQIETDENIARGMSPEEARYAAHQKPGNLTQIREEIYQMNSLGWLETLWQDVRYSLRQLKRSPGFTAVAVITLSILLTLQSFLLRQRSHLCKPSPCNEPNRLDTAIYLHLSTCPHRISTGPRPAQSRAASFCRLYPTRAPILLPSHPVDCARSIKHLRHPGTAIKGDGDNDT